MKSILIFWVLSFSIVTQAADWAPCNDPSYIKTDSFRTSYERITSFVSSDSDAIRFKVHTAKNPTGLLDETKLQALITVFYGNTYSDHNMSIATQKPFSDEFKRVFDLRVAAAFMETQPDLSKKVLSEYQAFFWEAMAPALGEGKIYFAGKSNPAFSVETIGIHNETEILLAGFYFIRKIEE